MKQSQLVPVKVGKKEARKKKDSQSSDDLYRTDRLQILGVDMSIGC